MQPAPPKRPPQPAADQPGRSLLRSSAVVGVMTLLSRFLGLARDIVIARLFGDSASADAFFVAFKIPNFFRRLFAEGAFSQAFVPVLSDYKVNRDVRATRQLVNRVAGTLGGVLFAVTALAVLGSPAVTALFAPGFLDMPEKFDLAASMLRLTFPYLLLISLTAFAGAILNSYGQFAVPAFTPVLLNLSLIGAALWLTPYMEQPVMALAWGVLIAGCVQCLFQLPFLLRLGLLPRPLWGWGDPGVRRILKLMAPALFGVSVSQINLLLDTVLASFLVTGSVSWLYYSDRLSELPLGVFGIAIATVILPNLSQKRAAQSLDAFGKTLDWGVRCVLVIGLPAALALILLAEPLLITLFHYGVTTEYTIQQSAASLRAYALGLLAFMMIKVLAPGFFAREDVRTPVKVGIIAMVANMVFNLLLIWHFAHVGLALATSLSAFLNASMLFHLLRKQGIYQIQPGWGLLLTQMAMAAVVMMVFLQVQTAALPDWFAWGWQQRVLNIAWVCGAGAAIYFAMLWLSGVRLRHFSQH